MWVINHLHQVIYIRVPHPPALTPAQPGLGLLGPGGRVDRFVARGCCAGPWVVWIREYSQVTTQATNGIVMVDWERIRITPF